MSESIPEPTETELLVSRRRQHHWIAASVIICLMIAVGATVWLGKRSDSVAPQMGQGGPEGPGSPGGPPESGGPGGAPATTIGMAAVELADMPVMLEALGTVVPTATATVRAQVAGNIAQVLFQEGQLVKAGDVLVRLDARSYENARLEAEGNLHRDEANLASARLTLERYQKLLQQDSIAGQDVDTQAATVKQLEGTVMADRAAQRTAELNLSYTKITAPLSGRVGLRVVDVGNYVTAGDSAGVAVITVMDPIDVEFAVPQDQIPAFQKRLMESGVSLPTLALDRSRTTQLAQGHFATLDNRIDTTTGTVKAKARFPNKSSALFPNQFVNVRVQLDTLKDRTVVPAGAVRRGANGDFVYVLNRADSTVAMRNVKTGLTHNDRIVIDEGVKVGEEVISEGGDRLRDGARVQLPGAQPAQGEQPLRGQRGQGESRSGKRPVTRSVSGPGSGPSPAAG